jgi:hypothetical protein
MTNTLTKTLTIFVTIFDSKIRQCGVDAELASRGQSNHKPFRGQHPNQGQVAMVAMVANMQICIKRLSTDYQHVSTRCSYNLYLFRLGAEQTSASF